MGADVVQMVMVAGGALAFAATVLGRRKNRRPRSPPSVDRPDAPATHAAVFALQPGTFHVVHTFPLISYVVGHVMQKMKHV